MVSLLLPVIYVAFISLGLPDSILGAAWPVMQKDLLCPLQNAGIITMIISGGTIVSSLLSSTVTKKFGAGLVTAFSVAMTAAALAGFSFAESFAVLCLWSVPYGLGAGAVDSALNNYVALHFKARHMSWLHCFWGVGASLGPYIMGFFLNGSLSWHGGYRAISLVQVVLTVILFASLPMWKSSSKSEPDVLKDEGVSKKSSVSVFKIKGLLFVLVAFFAYCAMENTTGLWASSYLVNYRGVEPKVAARFASFFYLGITGGRLINGFIAEKLGDRRLTRWGILLAAFGICMIALPLSFNALALAGLVVTGLGCAPIYPSIIHATPANFGKENSQSIVGLQMACAYTGSTFMPLVFGLLASHINISLYPLYLIILALTVFLGTETLSRILPHKK